jgi:hypothetical protein
MRIRLRECLTFLHPEHRDRMDTDRSIARDWRLLSRRGILRAYARHNKGPH